MFFFNAKNYDCHLVPNLCANPNINVPVLQHFVFCDAVGITVAETTTSISGGHGQ